MADYDDIARKLLLAHHAALIDRPTLDGWLNDGAHALCSLFALSQHYRYSGCTRDDFAANNAAARAALEKFGELPQDVLEGTRRSRFARPIVRRHGLQAKRSADIDNALELAADNNQPASSSEAEPAVSDDGVQVQTCITSPPYFRLRSYLPSNHPDKPLEIGACETPEQYIAHLVQVFCVVRELLVDNGTLWIVIGDSYAGSRSARPASAYIGGKHGMAQAAVNRITPSGDIKAKDLLGIQWQLAFALRRDGWTLRQDIIWHKPNTMSESAQGAPHPCARIPVSAVQTPALLL